MKKLRCAIYTRKSTDEGLDQSFNSLDAQREACGAYILSQAGEGWVAAKNIYDDGGFSGGSMDRPALKQLLAEVEAGRVDVIVVYKVDRLTRSLADFARIVEVLDQAGASFVSVTQAFNTTTSMGRLTLNVLLSFAQFEREVTGERIRDKIAQSKARGMWMGGHPPLGYEVRDRALHINAAEADTVRLIFDRYLSARSVYELRDSLNSDDIKSKAWISSTGKEHGGVLFTHGALYHILANRIYVGEIVHRELSYPGQHAPIITPEVFTAVQQKLKAGVLGSPITLKKRGHAPTLLGKLFDDSGSPMTSTHANKGQRRYLYYVSTARTQRRLAGSLARVSAPRLEQLVSEIVNPILDPHFAFSSEASTSNAIRRVELGRERITIELEASCVSRSHFDALEDNAESVRVERTHQLARPSMARRLLSAGNERAREPRIDRALVRGIVQARRWQAMITSSDAASILDIAQSEGVCPIYMGQLLPLAFLAPDLIEAIIDGRQPTRLSLIGLIKATLPMRWDEQRALFARFA